MNTDKIIAEKIASEYVQKTTSKIVELKKLDRKAKRGAQVFGYIFGSIASLVLGVGMCLAMGEIGDGSLLSMIIGIVIGVVGIVCASVNYPIYKKILQKGKMKYGSDIVNLAKEISE